MEIIDAEYLKITNGVNTGKNEQKAFEFLAVEYFENNQDKSVKINRLIEDKEREIKKLILQFGNYAESSSHWNLYKDFYRVRKIVLMHYEWSHLPKIHIKDEIIISGYIRSYNDDDYSMNIIKDMILCFFTKW